MVLETFIKLCMTAHCFGKTFFAKLIGKWTKKMAKNKALLNLKKKLDINFHRICFIMKVFIICCLPEKILWEKSLS